MAEEQPKHRAGPGGRPSRRDAQRRLRRVLVIARRRFLADGYEGTSLEAIARESGIAKKTLYHHFGSKEGLFAAILAAQRDRWASQLRALMLEPARPERVLEDVALRLLDVGTRPGMVALHRLLLAEAPRFPALVRQHHRQSALRGMEPLGDYLRAAAAAGSVRLDDVDLATEQFTNLVLGGVRLRLLLGLAKRPGEAERRRLARRGVALFLGGCRGTAPALPVAPSTAPDRGPVVAAAPTGGAG